MSVSDRAIAEIEKRRRLAEKRKYSGIVDFVPLVQPGWLQPSHISGYVSDIQKALLEPGVSLRICGTIPPRHSKAICVNTPMLTRDGWKSAGEIKFGDEVVASNGGWTKIIGVYPQGEVDLYDVSFSDGSSIRACEDHRWAVTDRYTPKWKIRTTRQVMLSLKEADGRCHWRIPMLSSPWVGLDSDLPLDPYLLGTWLGDGHSHYGAITTMDKEIEGEWRRQGFISKSYGKTGKAETWGLTGLIQILKPMGLVPKKFIPDIYLNSSPEQRLAVIQGLCDTDGTVPANGSYQSYTTTAPRLAEGFKFLVVSLGGKWTQHVAKTAGKDAIIIQFRLPDGLDAFRLSRKLARLKPPSPRNRPRRFIENVEPNGRGEAVCFKVMAEDCLFAAGKDLVLTHNTESLLFGIAWALLKDPSRKIGYATYSAELANSKSARCRQLAERAGVKIDGALNRMGEWTTREGGGLKAGGVRGSWTGRGFDCLIIDDCLKDREEAESPTIRRKIKEWFDDVADSRIEPGGSIIVNMTRWHQKDLVGVLLKEGGWTLHKHSAILNEGTDNEESLWPERWPLEELQKKRARLPEYSWASLYRNEPVSRGGTLFGAAQFCDSMPDRYTIGRGVDLAYTLKKSGDHCAYVEMLATKDDPATCYISDVVVMRAPAEVFSPHVNGRISGGPRPLFRMGGQEATVSKLLERLGGLSLRTERTKGDKWTNALDLAGDWNAGRVLIPRNAPWAKDNPGLVQDLVEQFTSFTGLEGEADDIVDAAVSAHKEAISGKVRDVAIDLSLGHSGNSWSI